MLKLKIITGPHKGRHIRVKDDVPVSIGRNVGRMRLHDSRVSKRHAEIVFAGGSWLLRDLDSSNGSYVNHKRLTGLAELEPGDLLQFGRITIRVREANAQDVRRIDRPGGLGATATEPSPVVRRPLAPPAIEPEEPISSGYHGIAPATDDDPSNPGAWLAETDGDAPDEHEGDHPQAVSSSDTAASEPVTPEAEANDLASLAEDKSDEADPDALEPDLNIETGVSDPDPGDTGWSLPATAGAIDVDAIPPDTTEETKPTKPLEPDAKATPNASGTAPPADDIKDQATTEPAEAETEEEEEEEEVISLDDDADDFPTDTADQILIDDDLPGEGPSTGTTLILSNATLAAAAGIDRSAALADSTTGPSTLEALEGLDAANSDTIGLADDAAAGFSPATTDTPPPPTATTEPDYDHDYGGDLIRIDELEDEAPASTDEPAAQHDTNANTLPMPEDLAAEEIAEAATQPPAEDMGPSDTEAAPPHAPVSDTDDGTDNGGPSAEAAPTPIDLGQLRAALARLHKHEAANPLTVETQEDPPQDIQAQAAENQPAASEHETTSGLEDPGSTPGIPDTEPEDQPLPHTPDTAPADEEAPTAASDAVALEDIPPTDADTATLEDEPLFGHDDPGDSGGAGDPGGTDLDAPSPTSFATDIGIAEAIAQELNRSSAAEHATTVEAATEAATDAASEQADDAPPITPPPSDDPTHTAAAPEPDAPAPGDSAPDDTQPKPKSSGPGMGLAAVLLLISATGIVLYLTGVIDPATIVGRDTPTTKYPAPTESPESAPPNPPYDDTPTPTDDPASNTPDSADTPDTDKPNTPPATASGETRQPNPFANTLRVIGGAALVGRTTDDRNVARPTDPGTPNDPATDLTAGNPHDTALPPLIVPAGDGPATAGTDADHLPDEPAAGPDNPNPAAPADGDRLVFLVDCSGSLVDSLPQMLLWLQEAISTLGPTETFTIIFFKQDQAIETPPLGLQPLTRTYQHSLLTDWLDENAAPVFPAGRSDPAAGLDLALGYHPSDIYLLSDEAFGQRTGETTPAQVVTAVSEWLAGTDIRVHGVQFFYDNREGALETLAERFGGTYEFVEETRHPDRDPIDLLDELEHRNR